METKGVAHVYLVASLLIGSLTPVLLLATRGADAVELFFLASLVSLPIGLGLVAKNRKRLQLIKTLKNRRKLIYIVIAALLMYLPYEYGLAYAEHFISASLATAVFRLNPLLMLIFLPLLLWERLSRRQIAALGVGFVGLLVGISGGNIYAMAANPDVPIIIFVVLLALGYALANVIIKRQMIDNDQFLAISALALTVFFGTLFAASGAHYIPLTDVDWALIGYLAITNIFSFYMYVHALKVLKTTIVTNVFMLSPFFTFVWAFALFGEAIKAYYLVMAALIGLGILVQRTDQLGGLYMPRKHGSSYLQFAMLDVTGAFAVENSGDEMNNLIGSGGRVIAAKVASSGMYHVEALANDSRFRHVYVDTARLNARPMAYVMGVLEPEDGDAVIIKAGQNPENDEFFSELGKRMETGLTD